MTRHNFLPHPVIWFVTVLLLLGQQAFGHGTQDESLISPAELAANLDGLQIIDIRTVDEYTTGHVPGALSLPLPELSQQKLASLGIDSDKTVIICGVSENSSQKAKLLLDILGYQKIRILAGGFTHYQEDKQPVETGPPQQQELGRTVGGVQQSNLTVSPEIYDFGVITGEGGVVSTTFIVENQGSDKITVTEITTSCGCTSATIAESSINPGESTILTVYFDPNFHKEPVGRFSRTVFMQTSEGLEVQAKIHVEILNQQLAPSS